VSTEGGVPVSRVLAEHRRSGATVWQRPLRARPRGGGLVPGTSRRVGERSPAPQALGELCVRPSKRRGPSSRRGASRRSARSPDGWDARRPVRPVLLLREAPVRRLLFGLAVLSVGPPVRLTAQDTSAIDRGVRIGIIYRPGVRPGMVLLPVHAPGLDSVRAIMARDLDYSDRFELITLPGGDSMRVTAAAPGLTPRPRAARGGTGGGGAAAATDAELSVVPGARRRLRRCRAGRAGRIARSPPCTTWRRAACGASSAPPAGAQGRRVSAGGASAGRPRARSGARRGRDRGHPRAVRDGGQGIHHRPGRRRSEAGVLERSPGDVASVGKDGRRFSYMEFWEGHGRLFRPGRGQRQRAPVATTGQALDFTPAFLARWQDARLQPRHRGGHRPLHGELQGWLLLTALDRGALLRQLVTDLQSRRPAHRVVSTRAGCRRST